MGISTKTAVLALDSAMNGCGAAVYFPDEPARAVCRVLPMARGQAEELVPLVQDVLAMAGIGFDALGLVVTTRGPGTFTGLRVGMSAARSFALTLDVPLVGVTTLEVLARSALEREADLAPEAVVAVLIETKRSDYYAQLWSRSGAVDAPSTILAGDVAHWLGGRQGILAGDAPGRLAEELGGKAIQGFAPRMEGYDLPDPLMLARCGLALHRAGKGGNTATPLYLRGADVSIAKNSARVLEQ